MTDHFAAFSFVDRIDELVPASRARGGFAIPPHLPVFPACLVAEAVGQLAAWVSMAHIGFRGRPVAALASETRFLRGVHPGDRLTLSVEIESCDDEAVAYHGHATVGGERVIELVDCLGPMLPLTDFDDPAAMREWFGRLTAGGAAPGRFRGVDIAAPVAVAANTPAVAEAILTVPSQAAFFNDHFPRRAVFPATLMLDAQIGVALRLARASGHWPADADLAPVRMTHVKVRAFTEPGSTLRLRAEMRPSDGNEALFMLAALAGERTVATARVAIAQTGVVTGLAPMETGVRA